MQVWASGLPVKERRCFSLKGSGKKPSLTSYDDIFSTEETRQAEIREQIRQVRLSELHPFREHPFRVVDDDRMMETVESVKEYGVLVPLIVRPMEEGGYEIVSGHRRKRACELAGVDEVPVIVRNLDDDEAVIIMVDARTTNAREITALIRDTYGGRIKVFDAEIPRSVRAAEITTQGTSIYAHDPGGKVAQAYHALTKEVLQLEKQRQKAKSDLLR